MKSKDLRTALIVAGGTGGHLYPGIATAKALVQRDTLSTGIPEWKVVFAVRSGDRGKEILQREGFDVRELPGQGIPRQPSFKIITFPFVLLVGFLKADSLLNQLQPNVVVGMGGYLSFPVLMAARLKKIPTLIHEQNVYPGLANRILSRWVNSIAVSFPESRVYFPKERVWLSGLPVRPEFGHTSTSEGRKSFNLAVNKTTFLIVGGSQGAHRLNQTVTGVWPLLSEWNSQYQVLHVTGERDYDEIRECYRNLNVQSVVMPYCHDMASAFGAADLVICRAGASTLAELIVARCPAILVPFPFASENHQAYNAEVMVKCGGAELIEDAEFTPASCAKHLRRVFQQTEKLSQMRQRLVTLDQDLKLSEAAQRLALHIHTLL